MSDDKASMYGLVREAELRNELAEQVDKLLDEYYLLPHDLRPKLRALLLGERT